MPTCCAVVGCKNRQTPNSDKKFYVLPGARDNRGRPALNSILRRHMWIEALHRTDLTTSKINNARICSDHFITGKPAPLDQPNDPDFVPSVNMGSENRKRKVTSGLEKKEGTSRKYRGHFEAVFIKEDPI